MVCYYYPPVQSSGTSRSLAFSKNLKELGWNVSVLTVKHSKDPWVSTGGKVPEGIRVLRTREFNLSGCCDFLHAICCRIWSFFGRELRKNVFRAVLCFPDPEIVWWKTVPLICYAKNFDCFYVSCSPFSSALSAALASRFTKKPLVVDFRDAWLMNPYLKIGRWQKKAVEFLEKFVVGSCDFLILNTPGAERLYRAKYPEFADRFTNIPNGYDFLLSDVTAKNHNEKIYNKFTIAHAGSFYGSRSPRQLLEAMSELQEETLNGKIQLTLEHIGPAFEECDEFRKRINIVCHGVVEQAKATQLLASADALYLKQGREPGIRDYIAVAAKTYEYLAMGTPILADVPPGDNAEIVQSYSANSIIVSSNEKADLKQAILELIQRRKQDALPNPEFVKHFNRAHLTKKLSALLETVVERKRISRSK